MFISESNQMKKDGSANNFEQMNNPCVDLAVWARLRERWGELQSAGHKLKVDFRLLADPTNETNILAIDVVQTIDEEVVTETVERNAGEAYKALGIAELSSERLVEAYEEMLRQLHNQVREADADLILTLFHSSPTSGEVRAYTMKRDSGEKTSLLVGYQHYYMLKAIREKMMKPSGMVKAVYSLGNLEFYFE